MAETFFDMDKSASKEKKKSGIKSFLFTATGKNGESHRKNRVAKAKKGLANRIARAALYQERGRMGATQWHISLDNLSKGLAT